MRVTRLRLAAALALTALLVTGADAATAAPAMLEPAAADAAPVVRSVQLSQTRVPAAGGTVTVRLRITDDGTGVQTAPAPSLAFGTPSADVLPSVPLALVDGTVQDGTWSVDYPFAAGARLGTFLPRLHDVQDAAGHTASALIGGSWVGFGTASAPTGVTTSVQPGRVLRISWSAPVDDGGSPVTGYTIMRMTAEQQVVSGSGNAGPVIGTTSGTTTSFDFPADADTATQPLQLAVAAVNAAGPSPAVATTGLVTVPATAPGAPRIVAVAPGDRSLTVSWQATSAPHGASVVGHTARAMPGNHVCTATTAQACTITGLASHVPYAVTVTGDDGAGATASDARTAVPVGTLDAPVGVVATAVPGGVRVRWGVGADGTGADAFQVDLVPAVRGLPRLVARAPASARSTTVQGAVAGVRYRVTVVAIAAEARTSEAASLRSVTALDPQRRPARVSGLTVTARRLTSARVAWSAPEPGAAAAVDRFQVRLLRGNAVVGTSTVGGTTLRLRLGSLAPAHAYRVRVSAHNAAGWGPPATAAVRP